MSHKGSLAVSLLEYTYQSATRVVADTPEVAFTIKASGRNRNSLTLGHYAPGRFRANGDPLPEVMIAGETIQRGPVDILTTVLHEAAHATARHRDVKDTSRQGRYHNRKFVQIAEEYHLTYDVPANYRTTTTKADPEPRYRLVPDDTVGYSNVQLTPNGQLFYAGALDMLAKEFPFDLGHGERTAVRPRQRWHGYLAFPRDAGRNPSYDVVQIAPVHRELLLDHLDDHVYVQSCATLAIVSAYLHASGVRTNQPDPPECFELDTEHAFPELVTFTKEILTR